MDLGLAAARLLLAAVFLVAAVAKLVDRTGSRQALTQFGMPARAARPLAILLPGAELAVGVALLPAASARWGAFGALALLLLFVAAIGFSLARGRKPDCHCFGQLHSTPAGWRTLARNAFLAGAAGFVAWSTDPGPNVLSWLGVLNVGAVALGLCLVEALVVVNLLRQNGRLLIRLDTVEARLDESGVAPATEAAPAGLRVGTPAPGFALAGLFGETLTLDFLRSAEKPVLVVFSDPNCGPCNGLLPEIGAWQRTYDDKLTIAVLSRGAPEANRPKSEEHGLIHVLLQDGRDVDDAYEVRGTPSAVVVRADGTVGSSVAEGPDAIRALVATAVATAEPPAMPVAPSNGNGHATPRIGDRAPMLRLRDAQGRRIQVARTRGLKTLVLFWNPQCGFCQAMLDDIRAWEASPPEGAPRLVVVSGGTAEETRAMHLRSRVLLDPGFKAGTAFGATGTPSAVLLDGEGRISSELAVGAPAVLALAGVEGDASRNGVPAPLEIGDQAPSLALPDLDGTTVDLAEVWRGHTLVLFWNPDCGYCSALLDDLKSWEASRREEDPSLLVIAKGTAEENRASGFRSPVLLDHDWAAASAFGMTGTPMALLVGEDGTVASEVAAGGPAVLELATRARVSAPTRR